MFQTSHFTNQETEDRETRKLPWSVKIAMSDLEVDSSSLKFWHNSYEEEYITQTSN